MASPIRCPYDILSIPRDAEISAIKKAHRKLILKYHPDKNVGMDESAVAIAEETFLSIQQAYECLSDPKERKWYDEHREAVLGGVRFDGTGGDDGSGKNGDGGSSFIFDVTPYHSSGCYDGFNDDDGDENGKSSKLSSCFYDVYRTVFQNIMEGEKDGWIDAGNIDETTMPNAHLFLSPHASNFGNSKSSRLHVSSFYNYWEAFSSSSLSYAWADEYDTRQAQSRWERRKMEEVNKKKRRTARKERNDDIIDLVGFVKKRDPRIRKFKEEVEKEKIQDKKKQSQ